MNLDTLMKTFTSRNIHVWLEEGQLRYRAPKGALNPAMREILSENKAMILAYLTAEKQAEQIFPFSQIEPNHAYRYQPFPLTDLQLAYWVGRGAALKGGDVGDHIYVELEIQSLDMPQFEIALQCLIERHEMLRAVILPDGQQQIVEHPAVPKVRVVDLRGQNSQDVAAQLEQTRNMMEHQWLSVERWPAFDLCVTLLDDQSSRIHVSLEALFVDATSLTILIRDFIQAYTHPEMLLEPLNLSFRDYMLAIQEKLQQTERYQHAKAYWLKRLPTLPPALTFSLLHGPGSRIPPRFVPRQGRLNAPEWTHLKARAALAGVTPTGVLLAAFSEILAAWSETPTFSVDLHLCNREAFHPQMNTIVGNFTSLVAIAVDHSVSAIFEKRAQAMQTEILRSLAHRYYTAPQVHRELARYRGENTNIVLPVMFRSTMLQNNADFQVDAYAWGKVSYWSTQTLQVLLDHHVFEVNGDLIFHWSARDDVFAANFVDSMFDAYSRLLWYLATTEAGWQNASSSFFSLFALYPQKGEKLSKAEDE